ncbi:unnamed protein product [Peronospora destructor]|uniref:Uncharacterized protein n=3 Tax=Peronospora destructor TaxID=86335 RepID=A0AAV0UI78_9STRA|nr:unnamed protein product [Peronospora destructor]
MELFPTPRVDDNEVRYCFFLPVNSTKDDLFQIAEQYCSAFQSFAADHTKGYLWHKHHFHLNVTPVSDGRYYLSGCSSVGDAIQDEWVVAKLVFDITTKFPGVVGRVADSDGEFLLIESAEALPDWVTPEDSDRRVFVLNGKLQIVLPPPVTSKRGKDGGWYDEDALKQVLDTSVKTEVSAAVQQLIQHKLDEVPTYMRENHHRVRCLLPERAAQVIATNGELVGPAVEAFYYREPKQTGLVCGKMVIFMPEGDEVVEQRVTFSRAMFAQLRHQEFFPPKPFLSRDARYRVLEKSKGRENTLSTTQAADIGVKLVCGLELVYAGDYKDQLGRPWKQKIDEALQHTSAKLLTRSTEPDDSDSWLYMHPNTLEIQLQRTATAGDASTAGGADELQNMADMFGKFVDGVSGVEGVESVKPVQFDMSSFMTILNGHEARSKGAAGLDAPWEEHFMDEDESDSDVESVREESDDGDLALGEAMAEMEAELAGTKVAKSFSPFKKVENDEKEIGPLLHTDDSTDEQVGSVSFSSAKPLDLDYNLLSNLLESFASQEGHAGPVSTILNEMSFP